MLHWFRVLAPWLRVLALAFVAVPAFAQVPQDTTFTGRLVDGTGTPLAGPVDLELRLFDSQAGGTELYAEQHIGVPLDVAGSFGVQLGLGTPLSATFGPELFNEPDRWLEVVVGGDVLSPRQVVASVPWSFVSERANDTLYLHDANGQRIGPAYGAPLSYGAYLSEAGGIATFRPDGTFQGNGNVGFTGSGCTGDPWMELPFAGVLSGTQDRWFRAVHPPAHGSVVIASKLISSSGACVEEGGPEDYYLPAVEVPSLGIALPLASPLYVAPVSP